MTPGDLVKTGACCGACLTATSAEARCRCQKCGGRLHGLLGAVDLRSLLDGRAAGLHQMSDQQVIEQPTRRKSA